MDTILFGTDTISSLGPKLRNLIPNKIKHSSTLSTFKDKIKSWTISNCPYRQCKIFVKDLGIFEVCKVSNGIHTNEYSLFNLSRKNL